MCASNYRGMPAIATGTLYPVPESLLIVRFPIPLYVFLAGEGGLSQVSKRKSIFWTMD